MKFAPRNFSKVKKFSGISRIQTWEVWSIAAKFLPILCLVFRPRAFLQCFPLNSSCSKAEHCIKVLGRVLGRKKLDSKPLLLFSGLKKLPTKIWREICLYKQPSAHIGVQFYSLISSSSCSGTFQKSENLQYNTLACWVYGTNDSLTKRLMFQALSININFL